MTAPTDQGRVVSTPEPTTGATPGQDPTFVELNDLDRRPPKRPFTRSRWWTFGFPLVLVALIASVPVLVYAGWHVVLQSHNGRLIRTATDPTKPGWEAAIEPTPTGVVATLADNGQLSSVTVLALSRQGAGAVIFVPADTQVPGVPGYQTMVDAYATGGATGLKSALEGVMGVDVGEVSVADSARWEELVGPIGTITVANPDSVEIGGTVFPRGSVDIAPAQVANYLRARNYGEDDTNRLLRQEAFWRAWMGRVAASGSPDAVPGESDSGVGRFARTLAAAQVSYAVLPVKVQARPDAYAGVFVPLAAEVKALVASAIPFPSAAPPGSRPRVRVLDGTGQLDHGVVAAVSLAGAGAQIDGIGNASNFDVATTQIIVTGEEFRPMADQLRAALGVGEVVTSSDAIDSVDITVILGTDAQGLAPTDPAQGQPAPGSTGTDGGGAGD